VAVVYLHGSAYYFLDKDLGTRPLFRHLAAQGHVVVDVAYRLFPETDVAGMVADAKRAVAWTQSHASDLGIDPARVVLVGGSSGGHLALLAAYAHEDSTLTPSDLVGFDPEVCAVASLYGQVDLAAMHDHTSQAKTCHADDPQPDWDAPPPRWVVRLFGAEASRLRLQFMMVAARCDWLVGATPSALPDRYAQLSAINHVHSDGPPTLLVHGRHDEMAPVAATRRLQERLELAGEPVSAVYLPHTDHAFDLFGTMWSPAARTAIHVLERFLAVVASPEPVGSAAPASRTTRGSS
jgi:acetyl esterase/lipase